MKECSLLKVAGNCDGQIGRHSLQWVLPAFDIPNLGPQSMRCRRSDLIRFLALWLFLFCAFECRAEEGSDLFEVKISPIFAKKCGKCHNANTQKASLDMSSIEGIREGGESGERLLGVGLDESFLWHLINEQEMPPGDEPPLTEVEIDLIREWLASQADGRSDALNQHDVQPIVLLRCAACHGARLKEGELDMRTPRSMVRGGVSGPAFVSGDPDASLMIQRIESEACPPREKLLKFFVRRTPQSEVDILRRWIRSGAPVENVAPDIATTAPDPLVSDKDREHWAFVAPVSHDVQRTLDDFIEDDLRKVGLKFSPQADRDTLIRRAYHDLTGLPPSRVEWMRWRSSQEREWYSEMIDHLLASKAYGERWGRYWLDVAGYSDSEGGVSADPVRAVAWKYRDYVVDAFNRDLPYNQFLVQQIAGDELIDVESAEIVTDQMVENLVATGFLRMGIDQTGSRTMNFVPERLGVIDDVIRVLGSGVLGLTMECAKCHSHKYDAIPQRDYYRMKAIFQGALDEHDWLSFKNRKLSFGTSEHQVRVKDNSPINAAIKRLEREEKSQLAETRLVTLRAHYPEQSESDRKDTIKALGIADNNRSQIQRVLVEKLQRAELIADAQQPSEVLEARQKLSRISEQIAVTKRELVPPLTIRALWDRGDPSPTYLLRRGEHDKPGPLIGPGVPSVLTDGKTPFNVDPPFAGKTGRRLALARWLTQDNHPLTARVFVNRVWYHHFGKGLVRSLENFGVQSKPPSHPDLLDWLASGFIRNGWSVKTLHRVIMNSRTYKQSSRVLDSHRDIDPNNELYARMDIRRKDAESLRDSLLFVSGKLSDSTGGPPDGITVDREGLVRIRPLADGKWRRSLYAQYRRTETPTMMDTFDYPEMGPNCTMRNVSVVSPQSLYLLNNDRVSELADSLAERIVAEAGDDPEDSKIVETIYHITFSREPTSVEYQVSIDSIDTLREQWSQTGNAETVNQRALATYCHTILNTAAFLYVD